jgi:uncharacterized short protein YbdD (DUF466 family)
MSCRICSPSLVRLGRLAGQTARLMVGVPDYDVYAEHIRRNHPDRRPMSREEFFNNRQESRYGAGPDRVMRCC